MSSPDRPFVTLTWAQSLDGCIAAAPGARTRISGGESAAMTQRLRADSDAILVGVGTVLADDPSLACTIPGRRSLRPVVLDASLRLPPGSRLARREDLKPWVFSSPGVAAERRSPLEEAGCRVLEAPPATGGGLDLGAVLAALYGLGVRSLMVEGGAKVLSSFFRSRLVDRVVVTVAPLFLGGYPALPELGGPGRASPLRLAGASWERMGEDMVIEGKPIWPAETAGASLS